MAQVAAPTGNHTADTAAIQNAINAVNALGGGIVRGVGSDVGNTHYTVDGIVMKSRVTLADVSLKAANGLNGPVISLEHNYTERTRLQRVTIDGNKANQTDAALSRGIYFLQTVTSSVEKTDSPFGQQDPHHVFEDVFVYNCLAEGVRCEGRGEFRVNNLFVNRCDLQGVWWGASDSFLSNVSAGENGSQGIYVAGAGGELQGANTRWVNCSAWYNGRLTSASGFGIQVAAPRVQMTNCEAQDNVKHGWVLSGSQVTDVVLENCSADSNGNNAVNNSGVAVSSALSGVGFFVAAVTNLRITGKAFDRTGVSCQKYGIQFGTGTATVVVVDLLARSNFTAHVNFGAGTYVGCEVNINGQRGVQTPAFAASYTPDPYLGRSVFLTLTANITINNPATAHVGQWLEFVLTQDGTGTRTVTFGAAFKVANWTPNTAASKVNTVAFRYDGTNWQQVGAVVAA